LPFPLPPLAEQLRIVETVEILIASVDATRERFARVPAILKRFRRSVLAAACSGRLTEDWRATSPMPANAEELVEQIAEQRSSAFIATAARGDVQLPDLAANDPDQDIPSTWVWARVDELVGVQNGRAFPS